MEKVAILYGAADYITRLILDIGPKDLFVQLYGLFHILRLIFQDILMHAIIILSLADSFIFLDICLHVQKNQSFLNSSYVEPGRTWHKNSRCRIKFASRHVFIKGRTSAINISGSTNTAKSKINADRESSNPHMQRKKVRHF